MDMITMDDIRKELGNSVYGDKKTETRVVGVARGYTSGPKETAYEKSDLTKEPCKDEPVEDDSEESLPFDLDDDLDI